MTPTDASVAFAALVGLCAGLFLGLVPFFVALRAARVGWGIAGLVASGLTGLVVGPSLAATVAASAAAAVVLPFREPPTRRAAHARAFAKAEGRSRARYRRAA